jgi:hypothetical protein
MGTGTDNDVCMMALEGNISRGRVLIDCGFTKLMKYYFDVTAGTDRYIRNCAVWLCYVDDEFNSGE